MAVKESIIQSRIITVKGHIKEERKALKDKLKSTENSRLYISDRKKELSSLKQDLEATTKQQEDSQ